MAVGDAGLQEEHLDVLTQTGQKTGISKPRGDVHRDGDYHRAVHVWIYAENTQELLLQRRADCKDSWPGFWDISSAGHISTGDSSLITARRELQEELGVILPKDAFEKIFVYLEECVTNDGTFINNEFSDVYLVTTLDPIPLEAFTLQEIEVSAVKYISYKEYRSLLAKEDPEYVPYDVNGKYGQLFDIIERRYTENNVARCLTLQNQLRRYAPVSLDPELTGFSEADKEALALLIKAATIMDEIFHQQVWYSNPDLRAWLKEHMNATDIDKLKWAYYLINKSPWSCLDENEAFLTTADSAIKLLPDATRAVTGWKGLEYKAAFPMLKPPGANFYPPDMDKMEFELWKSSLTDSQKQDATGFFNVIKRHSEFNLDSSIYNKTLDDTEKLVQSTNDLYIVPFSEEYNSFLAKAAKLLHKAGDLSSSPSLKRFLHSRADAFLSNDYYDSDIAWMKLDSKLDVTIGPYETYEDTLFGYKATFEAFIGVRDDKATAQVELFGDNLQVLEQNLPLDNMYKSKDVIAAPIRVINLLYNAGDVKGPQTVAFNLPNDERIVKDHGTSMVMLKNVSEAKFKHILQPIADECITKEQQELVDFDSFFTHTICHECCHGIGPHSIVLPNGEKSTVRLELQELHSALEEAKADIVGLWALRYLIDQDLLPKSLLKSMYVSFLAGCFRSVRFGLEEAHGKGQALQFNWLYEKGAFILHSDEKFSVDFTKVEGAVESLSREILTIQAKGDKEAANLLLQKYCKLTEPLNIALGKLENVQVPVDIVPSFPIANRILE
ncbi:nudix hydrolase 3 isoform X1 [Morus notabilis]|uniref:nudix hydrolase 3 isoform X1 n=1 Tax=Morus notabilis TaxID=981085 RepID=UPI000CED3A3C|nr:nudix hydrolase 3 isoform X1 [Morus notabilis]